MVGGATNQQPQLAPTPPSSAAATVPTTEEEEFLKRNTDCVYFLASPLTCKKGSECEYRHSDIARVNPRDCWYWLNGNCLNPKCAFRHPPLDGLLGAEDPTLVGPSIPQAPVTPAPPYPMSKQGVACIFFQKGFCLKGHLCPFLHGPPNMPNNKPVQPPVQPNPVTKSAKTASDGPERSIQEQKFMRPEITQNQVELPPSQGKQIPRMQVPPPARNGGGTVKKNIAPPPEEPPRYKLASVVPPPVVSEFPVSRLNHGLQETHYVSDNDGALNGKEVEEYSREPTPGFDVLVDTEHGDSEYYPSEEQFGRSRDFEINHSTDYDVDRDMYGERRDYDHYNNDHGEGYRWDDHRTSSERLEASRRKRYPRDDSPDQFDKSDLRHRISKQRRGNAAATGSSGGGLRSVVSRDRDSHHERMTSRHHDRRLDPGSLSSRLRGRIKIPGRSSSPELRVEREFDMGRQHRSRYSPGRPSTQNRLKDRIKGRSSEDEGRDYRGEFSGPKRLSELKSGRNGEGYEDDRQSLGKRKYPRVESQQPDSFEGPKPLSEILKRKRGGSIVSSVNNEDNNNNNGDNVNKSNGNSEKGRKEIQSEIMDDSNKEEHKLEELEPAEKQSDSIGNEKNKSTDVEPSLNFDENTVDEDAMLDEELEGYEDVKDGDYDYEEYEEYMEGDEEDVDGKKETQIYS